MREMPARPRARLMAAAAMLLMGGGLSAATDPWDAPDAKWRQGPVKYLLAKDEDQGYKKLKQDEERSRFVEEFWAKRDPTSGTPENEYRTEFYRRAREAAARFTEDGGKGWQDDRGRVFILFGPPDDTVLGTSALDSGSGSTSGGGSLPGGFGAGGETAPPPPTRTYKFIYRANPLTGKKERLELNFTSEATGGYRLEEKIDWSNPLLRGLAPPPVATAPPPAPVPVPATPTPAPAEAVPTAPPEPETTPQSELMEMVRGTPDLAATLPLDVTINHYKAADASTFVTLTVEVKRSALPAAFDPDAMILAAEAVDAATGESHQRFFKAEHFGSYEGNPSATVNDTLLYQAERSFKPGTYKILFALKDPASGQVGHMEKELVVPGFAEDEFTLSTVTLVRKIERLAAPPEAGKLVPFVLGNFTVVPRPDNVYKQGEELIFYYQIYGPALDEVTKRPRVDLSYTFEKDVAGVWKMVGRQPVVTPNASDLVQAFGLPLTAWPAGSYRIALKVTDAATQKAVTAIVPFSIEGAAGPASKPKAKAKSKG